MQKTKTSDLLRKYVPVLPVLILLCVFFFYCRSRVQTEFPVLSPEDGVVDIRDVDFDADVYHIENHWDYYSGKLYTPQELTSPDAPQKDKKTSFNDEKGTWRIVLLAKPNTYLSLCSFSVDFSTRVFVNGSEVRNIGFVSDDPAETTPMVRYMTLPLYSGDDGRIEIVYQYANYIHNDAGFIQNTLISTPENIDEYQRGLTFWSLLLSGGLILLAFYFLLGAAFQKSREFAALALCCVVIAFRNQFFFGEHLLGAGYNFILEYRFVVLDVSLIPVSALLLIAAFFPKAFKGRRAALISLTVVAAILTACHFIVGTKSLVLLCHICYYVCAPVLIWFIYRLIRYFHSERIKAIDAVTLAAIALFIVMLIYEGLNSGSNSAINHFGVTPVTMVVCILILDIVINTRINKQVILLRDAERRNELLGQVNEMNRDFLRTVAHELRTPLTVISGYAQLMLRQLESGKLSDNAPERLETVRQEADRLAAIVGRLMDYTYGHEKEAELTAVDIHSLFESADAVLKPLCAKRGNTLSFIDNCKYSVHGNYELLLQVLINLIVNASTHTQDGSISVEASDGGDHAEFFVRDTGKGISPDVAPHIFEKGFTTTDGRGLGLAICKETVSLHGGTLELLSTGQGGSCFRFTIPKEGDK